MNQNVYKHGTFSVLHKSIPYHKNTSIPETRHSLHFEYAFYVYLTHSERKDLCNRFVTKGKWNIKE